MFWSHAASAMLTQALFLKFAKHLSVYQTCEVLFDLLVSNLSERLAL